MAWGRVLRLSLHGLPVLSEPELYRMFDVSEKKQDKIYFNHSALPEGLNLEDWCRSEVRAEDMDDDLLRREGADAAALPRRAAVHPE